MVPSTGQQCQLRDLPDRRYGHTQAGLRVCGGGREEESRGSCLRWEPGGWVSSHLLNYRRIYHAAWNSPQGPVLIGSNTAELLHTNGSSSVLFYLQAYFR